VGRTRRADRTLYIPRRAPLHASTSSWRDRDRATRQASGAAFRERVSDPQRITAPAPSCLAGGVASVYRRRRGLLCLRRGAATGKDRRTCQGRPVLAGRAADVLRPAARL